MSASATRLSFDDEPTHKVICIADHIEVINCAQGDHEWHFNRAGAITASMADAVRNKVGGLTAQQQMYVDAILSDMPEKAAREYAGYKAAPQSTTIKRALNGEKVGEYSQTAKDYAFRLAVERIAQQPLRDEKFETYDMRRGHEQEPDARALHAVNTGLRIKRAGIVRTKDGKFGASADSLIDAADNIGKITQDGGGEYKCFTSPEKLQPILIEDNPGTAMCQMQFCMWLTGRHWWHFGLYCEHLLNIERELTLIEVPRDDDYIAKLEADMLEFDAYVCAVEDRLRSRKGNRVIQMADLCKAA